MNDINCRIDVKMTKKAMLSFLFQHHYMSIAGIAGVMVSLAAWVLLIAGFKNMGLIPIFLVAFVGLLFVVLKPLMILMELGGIMKAYEAPISYAFDNSSVVITQSSENEFLPWDKIKRVSITGKMLALYDTKSHAFVLPLEEMGENKTVIIAKAYGEAEKHGIKKVGSFSKYR